ncbi:MAG: hypothetical protein COB45_10105 [Gammaproteobacteria bacterium]|nr:MAG: hypothetical protein COB45_10105 [Gammaproteobacteria bacterium]PHR83982.1 MAG: hypothetical protein COA59_08520 [Colwellia sp.]
MNRHLKVAFMVAPFLAVLGYVGADYYNENLAAETKIIQLAAEGHCDIINQSCVLKSGDFKVNVSDEGGVTEINSTFPLDTATLFLVDKHDKATPYPLGMLKSPYYWRNETPLRSLVSNKGDSYKLRLIIKIKGGQYISEFTTQTAK